MSKKLKQILSFLLCFVFIFEQAGFAQVLPPASPAFSPPPGLIDTKFRPLHLRYLGLDQSTNNLNLLLDKGDFLKVSPADEEGLKSETAKLLDYFKTGLVLSNSSFWVNLRPDSPDNIIDPLLAKTDVGKILLEADVQLKKDTALFTSPQTPQGKEYWDKIYQKAEELFGQGNMAVPTLTRTWIVPNEIIVRETKDSAYIYKATLKVLLEQDYLKGKVQYSFNDPRVKILNEYASELMRKLIIPQLNKDVNTAKRYASLRQVYYSLILAQWFKAKGLSSPQGTVPNSKDLTGLTSKTPYKVEAYYKQYKTSTEKGEYDLSESGSNGYYQVQKRYFAGGILLASLGGGAIQVIRGRAGKFWAGTKDLYEVEVERNSVLRRNIFGGIGRDRGEDEPDGAQEVTNNKGPRVETIKAKLTEEEDFISIALDKEGVIENIDRLARNYGLTVKFLGGVARRILLGESPISKNADVDIAVYFDDVKEGIHEVKLNSEQIERLRNFKSELKFRHAGLDIEIINVDEGLFVREFSSFGPRLSTLDRIAIYKDKNIWVVDSEYADYLEDARNKYLRLVPRIDQATGKPRPLDYENVLRFLRTISQFPDIAVDRKSLEEIDVFISTGKYKENDKPYLAGVEEHIGGFTKNSEDSLIRAETPPYKALLKVFIFASDPKSVIGLFQERGSPARNLFTIFSKEIDLQKVADIVQAKRSRGEEIKLSDFDTAFINLRENKYARNFREIQDLASFLLENIGQISEEKRVIDFMRKEHAAWLERVNSESIDRRMVEVYFLINKWKENILSASVGNNVLARLEGIVSEKFYKQASDNLESIRNGIASGAYKNLLDYYFKEFNISAGSSIQNLKGQPNGAQDAGKQSNLALSVREVSEEQQAVFLHGILPTSFPDENSLLKRGTDWQSRLDIVLALAPTVSAFTIKEGQGYRSYFARMGLIIGNGAIVEASAGDMGSVASGIDSRASLAQSLKKDGIEGIINGERASYNEIHIKNPQVLGFYINLDDTGGIIGGKTAIASLKEITEKISEWGLPLYGISNGRVRKLKITENGKLAEEGGDIAINELLNSTYRPDTRKLQEIKGRLTEGTPFKPEKIIPGEAHLLGSRISGIENYILLEYYADSDNFVKKIESMPGLRRQGDNIIIADFKYPRDGRSVAYFLDVNSGRIYKETILFDNLNGRWRRFSDVLLRYGTKDRGTVDSGVNIEDNGIILGTITDIGRDKYFNIAGELIESARENIEANKFVEYYTKFLQELAFNLYGYAEEADNFGDREAADKARALTQEIISEDEYNSVVKRRINANGGIRVSEEELGLSAGAQKAYKIPIDQVSDEELAEYGYRRITGEDGIIVVTPLRDDAQMPEHWDTSGDFGDDTIGAARRKDDSAGADKAGGWSVLSQPNREIAELLAGQGKLLRMPGKFRLKIAHRNRAGKDEFTLVNLGAQKGVNIIDALFGAAKKNGVNDPLVSIMGSLAYSIKNGKPDWDIVGEDIDLVLYTRDDSIMQNSVMDLAPAGITNGFLSELKKQGIEVDFAEEFSDGAFTNPATGRKYKVQLFLGNPDALVPEADEETFVSYRPHHLLFGDEFSLRRLNRTLSDVGSEAVLRQSEFFYERWHADAQRFLNKESEEVKKRLAAISKILYQLAYLRGKENDYSGLIDVYKKLKNNSGSADEKDVEYVRSAFDSLAINGNKLEELRADLRKLIDVDTQESDFLAAGSGSRASTRVEHEEFHDKGEFAKVIEKIAEEIGAELKNGRYDLRGAIEGRRQEIETPFGRRKGLLTSAGMVYIEYENGPANVGILVIMDSRFKENHAGRNEYAVYARNKYKVVHELTELRLWADLAMRYGIAPQSFIENGQLGIMLRIWMNPVGDPEMKERRKQEVKKRAEEFHRIALEAENQYRYKNGSAKFDEPMLEAELDFIIDSAAAQEDGLSAYKRNVDYAGLIKEVLSSDGTYAYTQGRFQIFGISLKNGIPPILITKHHNRAYNAWQAARIAGILPDNGDLILLNIDAHSDLLYPTRAGKVQKRPQTIGEALRQPTYDITDFIIPATLDLFSEAYYIPPDTMAVDDELDSLLEIDGENIIIKLNKGKEHINNYRGWYAGPARKGNVKLSARNIDNLPDFKDESRPVVVSIDLDFIFDQENDGIGGPAELIKDKITGIIDQKIKSIGRMFRNKHIKPSLITIAFSPHTFTPAELIPEIMEKLLAELEAQGVITIERGSNNTPQAFVLEEGGHFANPAAAQEQAIIDYYRGFGENRKLVKPASSIIIGQVMRENLGHAAEILELGSGLGALLGSTPDEIKPKVIQSEYDQETLDLNPHSTPKEVIDAFNIPRTTGKVPAVVSYDLLNAVLGADKVLSEIYRVLEPGGTMVSFIDLQPAFQEIMRYCPGDILFPAILNSPDGTELPAGYLRVKRKDLEEAVNASMLMASQHPGHSDNMTQIFQAFLDNQAVQNMGIQHEFDNETQVRIARDIEQELNKKGINYKNIEPFSYFKDKLEKILVKTGFQIVRSEISEKTIEADRDSIPGLPENKNVVYHHPALATWLFGYDKNIPEGKVKVTANVHVLVARKVQAEQIGSNPVQASGVGEETGAIKQGRPATEGPGGIDFRSLPVATQSLGFMGSPQKAGTVPIVEAIKASFQKDPSQKNINQLLVQIADILRQEEESAVPTEPELKEILVFLEAGGKTPEKPELDLADITIKPSQMNRF